MSRRVRHIKCDNKFMLRSSDNPESDSLKGRMPHVGSLCRSGPVFTTLVRDRQATVLHEVEDVEKAVRCAMEQKLQP